MEITPSAGKSLTAYDLHTDRFAHHFSCQRPDRLIFLGNFAFHVSTAG
jgi:hypothetical protein